ncbi:MAG TPA: type II toxin-antitoxin system RelE/ParE family toxin [Polyangiales bacterium]
MWTDFALRDLERIDDYIAQDRPSAAARWVQKLIATADTAAAAPLAGRVVPETRRDDIREVLLRHYRIVYLVGESRIEILTVFEGHKRFPDQSVPGDE